MEEEAAVEGRAVAEGGLRAAAEEGTDEAAPLAPVDTTVTRVVGAEVDVVIEPVLAAELGRTQPEAVATPVAG